MAPAGRGNSNESMCEKSGAIAMNILRISSGCLARMTLRALPSKVVRPSGAKAQQASPPPPTQPSYMIQAEREPQQHGWLQGSSRHVFLNKPSSKTSQPPGVDERTEDFINRFRDKMLRESSLDADAIGLVTRRRLPPFWATTFDEP